MSPEVEPNSGFQNLLGYRLAEWSQGRAVLEMEVEPKHLNRAHVLHGGAAVTLLDTACGFSATYCPYPGRVRRVVTLSLNTNFTGQIRGGMVRAVATLIGGGAKIVFCRAELRDQGAGLIATAEGVFRYRSGSEHENGVPL